MPSLVLGCFTGSMMHRHIWNFDSVFLMTFRELPWRQAPSSLFLELIIFFGFVSESSNIANRSFMHSRHTTGRSSQNCGNGTAGVLKFSTNFHRVGVFCPPPFAVRPHRCVFREKWSHRAGRNLHGKDSKHNNQPWTAQRMKEARVGVRALAPDAFFIAISPCLSSPPKNRLIVDIM